MLRQAGDRAPVVFLTMHRDVNFARRALEGKTCLTPQLEAEVLEAMKQVPGRRGDPAGSMTPRQREVLQLLARGRSAKEFATALDISTRTVEFHKDQLMETIGLHASAELIHFAIKQGLVEL